MFVAPDSFPFSQSILFLLAVIVGGAGWVLGPVVGAAIIVLLPEMLSRPRRVPAAVLRRAAAGGALARARGRARHAGALRAAQRSARRRSPRVSIVAAFLRPPASRAALAVDGLGIAFGGIKAATDVGFAAEPGRITSVIGPNGAGKTTVLNMIGGFYRPDAGRDPAGRHGTRRRAGMARRARRHRAHLSDHAAVRLHERARQRA